MRGLFDSGVCFSCLCALAVGAAAVPAVRPAWDGMVRVGANGRPLDDRRPARLCDGCGCLVPLDDVELPFNCPACRHRDWPAGAARHAAGGPCLDLDPD